MFLTPVGAHFERFLADGAGEHIKIMGKGWVPDEDVGIDEDDDLFHWDHWEFNGGVGKPMKVTMICPHDEVEDLEDSIAYEGPLLLNFVQEVKVP